MMIAYHADGNLILQQAFKTRNDRHRIAAYNAIMSQLAVRGFAVDLQILDNEASAAYKEAITVKWKAKFQLVPPDMHRRNRAERAIRTFKSHFLSILAGVDKAFPLYLWDLLLPQVELTLNLLRQATLNPQISAWEYFQGPFDFNKMPLGPVGCRVLIHAKPITRQSWDFQAKQGFYIGPALDSYRCFKLVNADTKSQCISDTVEFHHKYLAIPAPTPEDRIIQGLQQVPGALTGATPPTSISQVDAIANLRDIFESWRLLAPPNLWLSTGPSQGIPRVHSHIAPRSAMSLPASPSLSCTPPPARTPQPPAIAPQSIRQQAPTPRQPTPRRLDFADTPAQPIPRVPVVSPPANSYPPPAPPVLPVCEPISHCTRSCAQAPLALFTSGRPYHEQVKYHIPNAKATRSAEEPLAFAGLCETYHMKLAEVDVFALLCEALTLENRPGLLALSVLDPSTGKFLEHRQLHWDPRYKATWDTS